MPFLFHFVGFDAVPKLEKDSDLDGANAQLEAGLGLPSDGSDETTSKDDGMLGDSSKANSNSGEPGKVITAMDPVVAMGADFVSLEKDSDIIGKYFARILFLLSYQMTIFGNISDLTEEEVVQPESNSAENEQLVVSIPAVARLPLFQGDLEPFIFKEKPFIDSIFDFLSFFR